MNYCRKCVLPDTRPGIFLNEEGICSACVGYEEKKRVINWEQRRHALEELLSAHRSSGTTYDCVIPVSGGKDSTYQVYVMTREYHMHPLCVTYRYADRTPLGQRNLENLRTLGVDLIEVAPHPEAERKFIRKTLIEAGDPCIPDHLGIFAVPLQIAVRFRIPLVIWGENPQLEYGGTAEDRNNPHLTRSWLSRHGTLQGKTAREWADEDLPLEHLKVYMLPTDEELKAAGVTSLFLGYYIPWDPVHTYTVAAGVGFQKSPDGPKAGLYDFADLDSTNIIVHHYLKWFKFGMTRLHDHISIEIRQGRMTREQGVRILKTRQERVPTEEIQILCRYLSLTEDDFWGIADSFRNPDIWKRDENGNWYIPDYLEGL